MAAVDLFLQIDGITGESTDRSHPHAIDAVAFSWAEHVQIGGGGGGGGSVGKVVMGELQVIMRTSVASPVLMLSCASGRRHATATLSARRRGRSAKDHLVIALQDVMVTGYRVGANESGDDDVPTDQLSLAFGRIEVEVRPVDDKGGLGPAVRAGWDLTQNEPVGAVAARSRRKPRAG